LKVQEAELKQRPDIVVSTPGRLIDHVRNTPCFTMDGVEVLVLDEADRMLEEVSFPFYHSSFTRFSKADKIRRVVLGFPS